MQKYYLYSNNFPRIYQLARQHPCDSERADNVSGNYRMEILTLQENSFGSFLLFFLLFYTCLPKKSKPRILMPQMRRRHAANLDISDEHINISVNKILQKLCIIIFFKNNLKNKIAFSGSIDRKSKNLSSSSNPSIAAGLSQSFIHPVNARAWPRFITYH